MNTAAPTLLPTHIAHGHELVRRLGEPLLGGNHAQVLADPGATRATLLEALARARDHVNLDATLLLIPGLRDDLTVALASLCRQRVRVQLLASTSLQENGCGLALESLRREGAVVRRLAPSRGVSGWMERRFQAMQRQMAVIDGRTAWLGPGFHPQRPVTEAPHVCVQGPIVQRMQRLFLATATVPESTSSHVRAHHFPALALSGRQRMGMMAISPDEPLGAASGCPMIGALETARFSIFIALSRRPPSRLLRQSIAAAARRGVNVSVLLQHSAPHAWPWRAACVELMHAGAWLYQGDGVRTLPSHCIVDGVWSSVAIDGGLGWRSGGPTDAHQLLVIDADFASELDDVCQTAMSHALLLDMKALAPPARAQRWFGFAPAGRGGSAAADPAIGPVPGPVEGSGLSP